MESPFIAQFHRKIIHSGTVRQRQNERKAKKKITNERRRMDKVQSVGTLWTNEDKIIKEKTKN